MESNSLLRSMPIATNAGPQILAACAVSLLFLVPVACMHIYIVYSVREFGSRDVVKVVVEAGKDPTMAATVANNFENMPNDQYAGVYIVPTLIVILEVALWACISMYTCCKSCGNYKEICKKKWSCLHYAALLVMVLTLIAWFVSTCLTTSILTGVSSWDNMNDKLQEMEQARLYSMLAYLVIFVGFVAYF